MKKLLSFLFALMLSFGLVACGSDVAEVSDNTNDDVQNNETIDEDNEETASEQEGDANNEETETTAESEDVQEDDNLRAVNKYTNKELGITGTTGPIEYKISAIQLKEIEVKSEEAASFFDASVGDVIHAITIEMSGENTSEEDVYFYLGQATIITNTKEQLEPNMFLSEHIKGEYLGLVRHSGYNVYILENSTVDELETIEIRVNGPSNAKFERIGEDVKHTIEVNK